MNVIYPNILTKQGSGNFYNSVNHFNSEFSIIYYPSSTLIFSKLATELNDYIHLFSNNELWRLDGILEDGTPVKCESLLLNEFIEDYFTFFLFDEISFGNLNMVIDYVKIPLVGFYEGLININFSDCKIETIEEPGFKQKENRRIGKYWQTQVESSSIKLKFFNKVDRDTYIKRIINITALMSVGLGREITFHRQLFFSETDELLEFWKRRVDYNFGLNPIVEKIDLSDYITQTLSKFESLESNKRKALLRAIDYVNSSERGYIEDRIFRVGLAWELLSLEYFPKLDLPKELKELKNEIKKTIKTWKKSYLGIDPNGVFTDRVSKAITWDKSITLMRNLADSEGINLEKVGINLFELKELRDNVAHTGKIEKSFDHQVLIDKLDKAVLGLRIIILRKLGYNGNIQKPIDNFLYRTDINYFLKEKSHNT